MQVQTVVGRVEGLGSHIGARPQLADQLIPIDARWIGMPVVAYRVKCGMTHAHHLSGDLQIDRVVPVVPGPVPAAGLVPVPLAPVDMSALPVAEAPLPDVVITGDGDVARHVGALASALISAAGAIWTFIGFVPGGSANNGNALMFCLVWGLTSVIVALAQAALWRGAKRERLTTYTVRSSDALLLVDAPGKPARFHLQSLQTIEKRLSRMPADGHVTLHFGEKSCCEIPGRGGDRVLHAVRRIRPDVVVAEYQPAPDTGTGGGS
jgi:hypothetical protein